jgi:hypothetical protein
MKLFVGDTQINDELDEVYRESHTIEMITCVIDEHTRREFQGPFIIDSLTFDDKENDEEGQITFVAVNDKDENTNISLKFDGSSAKYYINIVISTSTTNFPLFDRHPSINPEVQRVFAERIRPYAFLRRKNAHAPSGYISNVIQLVGHTEYSVKALVVGGTGSVTLDMSTDADSDIEFIDEPKWLDC